MGGSWLDSWCTLCWQLLLLILYFSVVQVDRWAAAGWTAGVLCAGSCCFLFFTSLWCRSTGGRQLVGQLLFSVLAAAASYSGQGQKDVFFNFVLEVGEVVGRYYSYRTACYLKKVSVPDS